MLNAPRYSIESPAEKDVVFIAKNMRQADADEVWASSHATPLAGLKGSWLASRDTSYVGKYYGVPVCMFGVVPPSLLGRAAQPWLLGTEEVQRVSRAFLRIGKAALEVFKSQYSYMENYVDARNVVSIRWLQWMGFSVYYPEPWGVDSLPFHRFAMGDE